MLLPDVIARSEGDPPADDEFSFLFDTYCRLAGSLAILEESLVGCEGSAAESTWSRYARIEGLMSAHLSLHQCLARLASLTQLQSPTDEVAGICAKISASVLHNRLSCRVQVDDAPIPGVVLQRFALLLYEIAQSLSLDAIYSVQPPETLHVQLERDQRGWRCNLLFPAARRPACRRTTLTTMRRAARRVGVGVAARETGTATGVSVAFDARPSRAGAQPRLAAAGHPN